MSDQEQYRDLDGDVIEDDRVYDLTMGGLTAPMKGKHVKVFFALAEYAKRNASLHRDGDS